MTKSQTTASRALAASYLVLALVLPLVLPFAATAADPEPEVSTQALKAETAQPKAALLLPAVQAAREAAPHPQRQAPTAPKLRKSGNPWPLCIPSRGHGCPP